jgi:hypothetical protein
MLAFFDSPAIRSSNRSGMSPARAASNGLNRNTNVEIPAAADHSSEGAFVPTRWLDRWEGEGGSWLRDDTIFLNHE